MINLAQIVMISRMINTTAVTPRLYASCTVKINKILLSVLFTERDRESEREIFNVQYLFFESHVANTNYSLFKGTNYKNNNQHAAKESVKA